MTLRTGKTPDQVYKTTLDATPEQVWDAITQPEFTKQYWFGNYNVSDWKKGSDFTHTNDEGKIYHVGKVLEVDPPRLLVISWHNEGDHDDVSNVRFEISAKGGHSELTIIHGDFIDGSAMAARVGGGWPKVVANLKAFLEGGGAMHETGCVKSA